MSEKMQKPFHLKKTLLAGALLLVAVFAVAGCSSKTAETQQIQLKTKQTQTTQVQANQDQGQTNPAVKVALDIMRIQRNQASTLTSAQCTSIKPILQELIASSKPTDEFLQQKADAITALFTEEQKTALTQKPESNKPQGNGLPPGDAKGKTPPPDGAAPPEENNTNTKDAGNKPNTMEPKEIYQQALAALK